MATPFKIFIFTPLKIHNQQPLLHRKTTQKPTNSGLLKNRVHSLDYLRGLMAFGIMVYHYFLWTGSHPDSGTLLGRTGIYGVSVFYVLSGLTLYIVYHEKLNAANIGQYFIKRVFRIFPLLWLSILLTLFVMGKKTDTQTLVLNLTGLFGFVSPERYIAIASWSIGNELVFYLFFPLVLLLNRKYTHSIRIFFIISALIGAWFAFVILADNQLLKWQWKAYVNPLNQLVLFSGGVYAGALFSGKKFPVFAGPVLMALSLLVFTFYPASGNQAVLVTGVPRLVFVLLSVTLAVSFLITGFPQGSLADKLLSRLGEATYSVYLLHPVVFFLLKTYAGLPLNAGFIVLAIAITLVVSTLVYNYFEVPFIRLGQRVINRQKIRN